MLNVELAAFDYARERLNAELMPLHRHADVLNVECIALAYARAFALYGDL